MNLENTKVRTTDAEVIRRYSALCGKPVSNKSKGSFGVYNSTAKEIGHLNLLGKMRYDISMREIDPDLINSLFEQKIESSKVVIWQRGDECEYYYWEGKAWRKGVYVVFDNHRHVIRDIEDNGYTGIDSNDNIRKPETEAERKERELVNDLCREASFEIDEASRLAKALIKIGYRKEQN